MSDPVAIRRVQRIGNDPYEAVGKVQGYMPEPGEQTGSGEGRTGERIPVNLRRRVEREIGHRNALVETIMNVITLGPELVVGSGLRTPKVSAYRRHPPRPHLPHAERVNPDGVCRTHNPAVSRPRGWPKSPAGEGRIEKRMPALLRGKEKP
jgi:hypothetical protein